MNGNHLTRQPPRTNMLTTVEKFQKMRQQKQRHLPVIFPIQGKQIFNTNGKKSCNEEIYYKGQIYSNKQNCSKDKIYSKDQIYSTNQDFAKDRIYFNNEDYSKDQVYNNQMYSEDQVYSKNQIYSKQQAYPREDILHRKRIDNEISENMSLKFLAKVEGILRNDLLRFMRTTNRCPNIGKKKPMQQEHKDYGAKHLHSLRLKMCQEMSRWIEIKRLPIHSFSSHAAPFSKSLLSVETQAKVTKATNVYNSDVVITDESKRRFKSVTDVPNKERQGNYCGDNVYYDMAHDDCDSDISLTKDFYDDLPKIELKNKKKVKKERSAHEDNGDCKSETQTINTVSMNASADRKHKETSERSITRQLGNSNFFKTGEQSDGDNMDLLLVTHLPPIHGGHDFKYTPVRSSRDYFTELDHSVVRKRNSTLRFDGLKKSHEDFLEGRNSKYLDLDDEQTEARKSYKMHIIVNIPDDSKSLTSSEPDISLGNDQSRSGDQGKSSIPRRVNGNNIRHKER